MSLPCFFLPVALFVVNSNAKSFNFQSVKELWLSLTLFPPLSLVSVSFLIAVYFFFYAHRLLKHHVLPPNRHVWVVSFPHLFALVLIILQLMLQDVWLVKREFSISPPETRKQPCLFTQSRQFFQLAELRMATNPSPKAHIVSFFINDTIDHTIGSGGGDAMATSYFLCAVLDWHLENFTCNRSHMNIFFAPLDNALEARTRMFAVFSIYLRDRLLDTCVPRLFSDPFDPLRKFYNVRYTGRILQGCDLLTLRRWGDFFMYGTILLYVSYWFAHSLSLLWDGLL